MADWIERARAELPSSARLAPTDSTSSTEAVAVWWRVHYADRPSVDVACSPPTTRAEILNSYPTAITAEPIPARPRRKPTEAETTAAERLYAALAARNDWPMPESWENDRPTILGDPAGALVTLRNLQRESGDADS